MKVSSHEAGYRAFNKAGLIARNPFSPDQAHDRARWFAGFDKARRDCR